MPPGRRQRDDGHELRSDGIYAPTPALIAAARLIFMLKGV